MVAIAAAAAFVAGCGAASTTSAHRSVPESAGEAALPSATPPRASARPAPHVTAPVMSTVVPGAPNCPMFPANNVWNTNISRLPLDTNSAAWLASMDSSTTFLHPDFGPDPGGYPFGIPFTVVAGAPPLVAINFQYADESDPGPYPFGPDTPIEGGAEAGGDRHAIMVNPVTCTLYELWNAQYSAERVDGGLGCHLAPAVQPPASCWLDVGRRGGPAHPARPAELCAGPGGGTDRKADHARDQVHGAGHSGGLPVAGPPRSELQPEPGRPAYGRPVPAERRLRCGAVLPDSEPYCRDAKAILAEMQNYGLILADNGSNWFFQGSAFPQWPDALVSLLKGIPASAFQAVDESCLMVRPNSAAVSAKPGCPIG